MCPPGKSGPSCLPSDTCLILAASCICSDNEVGVPHIMGDDVPSALALEETDCLPTAADPVVVANVARTDQEVLDSQLIALILTGDHGAWDFLLQRYGRLI